MRRILLGLTLAASLGCPAKPPEPPALPTVRTPGPPPGATKPDRLTVPNS